APTGDGGIRAERCRAYGGAVAHARKDAAPTGGRWHTRGKMPRLQEWRHTRGKMPRLRGRRWHTRGKMPRLRGMVRYDTLYTFRPSGA
ncbi:MAG: hypothetical protein OXP71_12385, partial [Candidatus Poribacteria bacterium]|nr:hypothetical protein [Candidatus Poribacteria bacterium]